MDYDEYGCHENGFDSEGIHSETGTIFNKDGWDIEGYNNEGYNINGFHRDVVAEFDRAIDFIEKKEFQKALNSFETVLENNPEYPQASLGKMAMLFLVDRSDEAVSLSEKLAEVDENPLESIDSLARIFHTAGDDELALNWYEVMLQRDPNNIQGLNGKRAMLNMLGRTDEAVIAAETVLQIDENNFESLFFLALQFFDTSRSESIPMFLRAIEIIENNYDLNDKNISQETLETTIFPLYDYASSAFHDAYLSKEALHCIDKCLEIKPQETRLYLLKASILADLLQSEESNEILFELLKDSPNNFAIAIGISTNFYDLEEFELSQEWLDVAEKNAEDDLDKASVFSRKGLMAMQLDEDYTKANEYFDESLSLHPHNTGALIQKLLLLKNTGKPEEAKKIASEIIEIKPYLSPIIEKILYG